MLGLLLVAAVFVAYWGARRCDFINLDDPDYVSANPVVQAGLTWAGVKWAFGSGFADNWHPVTWISLMVDGQCFGRNPAGYHLVSVLFHAAATVLLFVALARMTGATRRSALVAALFGLHPMHVESVVWLTERKDVLAGFFWMATLLAYVRYVERPRLLRYCFVLFLFTLGLMSKPMLVTLPFVLWLLDFWPLRRWGLSQPPANQAGEPARLRFPPVSRWRLVIEKLPLLALTAVASVVTYLVQRGAMIPDTLFPLSVRVGNAIVACSLYGAKTLWPEGLSVMYPHRGMPGAGEIGVALFILAIFSLLAAVAWRWRPYLLVGWLWFLGTLVPVLGFVQVGVQSMADRFSYIPSIGLFVMVVWWVGDWLEGVCFGRAAAAVASSLALLVLTWVTMVQVGYWKDSETLFRHALAVTRGNAPAHYGLGNALLAQGRKREAIEQFMLAVRLRPAYALPNADLGTLLLEENRCAEAAPYLAVALKADARNARLHAYYAMALSGLGAAREAVVHYEESARLDPNWPVVHNNLAWLLATHPDPGLRNGLLAVEHARRACEATGWRVPVLLGTLAAAYAETGQFAEAIRWAEQAVGLASAAGQAQIAERNKLLLGLYRQGQPYRETGPTQSP